jgi:hypothetical protein
LFIDDRRENVEAARAFGFRVHRYTGVTGLRKALSGANLLPT